MNTQISKIKDSPVRVTFTNDSNEALSLLSNLKDVKILGFDTETTGLNPAFKLSRIRTVQFAFKVGNGYQSLVIDKRYVNDEVIDKIREILESDQIKVGHNLKFDVKFSRSDLGVRKFGRCFDTLLGAQILKYCQVHSHRFDLASVAWDFLELDVSKEQQLSNWRGDLSDEQILYAGLDAVIPLMLRDVMYERLKAEELVETAKLEFDTIDPVASMELNGFYMNWDRWEENAEKNLNEKRELAEDLYKILQPDVQTLFEGTATLNLNSPLQVARCLKDLGVPVTFTKSGILSADKKHLGRLKAPIEAVGKYLRYSELKTATTRYGKEYSKFICPDTGRIHPDFFLIGAPTSRFSCSKPNLQQIPRGSEYRSCFEAEEGWTLLDADYSQIELRILAEFSHDPLFMDAFIKGHDFHQATAGQIFDVPMEEVSSEMRNFAKTLNFGLVYGISAKSFSEQSGMSYDDSEELMDDYFKKFPKMKNFLDSEGSRTGFSGRSWTGIGRIVKYEFDRSDRKKRGEIERNGKNTPIQGTSADILKKALRLLHNQIWNRLDIKLVNIVHDEIILEVKLGVVDEAREILQTAMIEAGRYFLKTVPVKVDIKSSLRWEK